MTLYDAKGLGESEFSRFTLIEHEHNLLMTLFHLKMLSPTQKLAQD